MTRPAPETASIVAGVTSALGASTCCVLPLYPIFIRLAIVGLRLVPTPRMR